MSETPGVLEVTLDGRVKAVSTGLGVISAHYQGRKVASTNFDVRPSTLVDLQMRSESNSLVVGQKFPLQFVAIYSDGLSLTLDQSPAVQLNVAPEIAKVEY